MCQVASNGLERQLAQRNEEEEIHRYFTNTEAIALGGNSIGFLDCLTDRLKMGDGLKMSDFGLGMS